MKILMQIFKILILVEGIFIVSIGIAQQNNSEVERNKEVVKKYFELVVNERKMELLDELFHQDRVNINWDTEEREGNMDELKNFLPYFFNAFPDLLCSVEEIIAEANKVMVKINYRGHHKGEFWGFQPTGNSINVSNAYLFYLEDGKIISSSSLINFKILESQLKIKD